MICSFRIVAILVSRNTERIAYHPWVMVRCPYPPGRCLWGGSGGFFTQGDKHSRSLQEDGQRLVFIYTKALHMNLVPVPPKKNTGKAYDDVDGQLNMTMAGETSRDTCSFFHLTSGTNDEILSLSVGRAQRRHIPFSAWSPKVHGRPPI